MAFLSAVLSIHKRPLAAHGDINFPMKGWRGMVDWARSSEDRVTVPKNVVSTEQTGESRHTAPPSCTLPTQMEHVSKLLQELVFSRWGGGVSVKGEGSQSKNLKWPHQLSPVYLVLSCSLRLLFSPSG